MSDIPPKTPSAGEVLRRHHLPVGGEFPFVPPKGWHPSMPLWPGGGRGFIDLKGRLWTKGRSITKGQYFEWDVQLRDGGHINVDWSGRITHPRPIGGKSRPRPPAHRGKK